MVQSTTPVITTTSVSPAKNVAFVSQQEMINILLSRKGAFFLSFVAITDARPIKNNRVTKQPNPWKEIAKIAKVNGVLNFYYEEGVLRRLEKEGKNPSDFRRGGSYHQPIFTDDGRLTPFCIHKADAAKVTEWKNLVQNAKGNVSVIESEANDFTVDNWKANPDLRAYLRFQLRSTPECEYQADGKVVSYDDIKDVIEKPSSYDNQGLDDPLKFLTYGLDAIQSFNLDGNTYIKR